MPDTPGKIADAASPGKQLGEIGDGAGKLADGGGKLLDQTANNTNNRVVIGLLIAVIVVMGLVWYNDRNTNTTKDASSKTELTAANAKSFQLLEQALIDEKLEKKELKEEIKQLRAERRESDSLAGEAAAVIRRLRAADKIRNPKK